MKTKSLAPVGSLHPILFLAGIYIIALFLAIFICSSLFYSCNASSESTVGLKQQVPAVPDPGQHTMALR